MRAILTLAAASLVSAVMPGMPDRYVVVPTSVPSEVGHSAVPAVVVAGWRIVAFEAHVSLDPRTRTASRTCTCWSGRPTG